MTRFASQNLHGHFQLLVLGDAAGRGGGWRITPGKCQVKQEAGIAIHYTAKWLLLASIFLTALLATVALSNNVVVAQERVRWTPQQRIPDYNDEAAPPYLVADQNRMVHVFNYQPVDDDTEEAIFYRTWTLEKGWTKPNDILLSPRGGAPQLRGVVLDPTGTFHLIYFAGNEVEGEMYYTHASITEVHRAPAWSPPVVIGENAGPYPYAALMGNDQGHLYVVYDAKTEGVGLYEVHSTNYGLTWSQPVPIYLTYDNRHWPAAVELTLDPAGRLHAVWSVWNQAGTSDAVYYARLEPDTWLWSKPLLLAQRDSGEYEADWASIIAYQGELFVIYQDGFPATRYLRRSQDWGETWSEPVKPWPHVGEYSAADFLVDSSDVLHVILGNRNGDCCHGMWHGVWRGNQWAPLDALVTGPKTPEFDPSWPNAVLSQGNVLLATWWTDTGGGPRNGAWFSFGVLNTAELPLVAFPTPTPTASPAPPTPTEANAQLPVSTSTIVSSKPAVTQASQARPHSVFTPNMTLIVGAIPAATLVLSLLYIQYRQLRRRH
jgi:hypothetical protein